MSAGAGVVARSEEGTVKLFDNQAYLQWKII
jgi:hypothetical protein